MREMQIEMEQGMPTRWIADIIGSEMFVLVCGCVAFLVCSGAATTAAVMMMGGLGVGAAGFVSIAVTLCRPAYWAIPMLDFAEKNTRLA
jgi:hypothetical protein